MCGSVARTNRGISEEPAKLAHDFDSRTLSTASSIDVIVQFRDTPSEKHHKKIKDKGGVLKTDLSGIINAGHYSLPPAALDSLSDDPDVTYISPDREVAGSLDYSAPAVGADVAYSAGYTGTGNWHCCHR